MRTPSKKTIEKYSRLIRGNVLTKQEINGFLKLLRSARYVNDLEIKFQIGLLRKQFGALSLQYDITEEHSAQGLAWLQNKVLLKRGGVSKNSGFGLEHEETIRNFKRFKFVGIHGYYNSYGELRDFSPIFRIIGKSDRDYVDYAPVYRGIPVVESNLNRI
jgi:hypothetical protein